MSLRDQMEADVSAVFLNIEEHAESVTYTPVGGIADSIDVVIDEDGTLIDSNIASRMISADLAVVFASRDAIPNPQLGDTITRTRSGYQTVYVYEGEYFDADAYSWFLRYRKQATKRMGGNVGQR